MLKAIFGRRQPEAEPVIVEDPFFPDEVRYLSPDGNARFSLYPNGTYTGSVLEFQVFFPIVKNGQSHFIPVMSVEETEQSGGYGHRITIKTLQECPPALYSIHVEPDGSIYRGRGPESIPDQPLHTIFKAGMIAADTIPYHADIDVAATVESLAHQLENPTVAIIFARPAIILK